MMLELATVGGAVLAPLVDAATAVGLPLARTTPDGTVVDDGGTGVGVASDDAATGSVEMASRFLFAIPDEVKTGIMLLLAAAIGVYLYLNWMRDQP